MKLLQKKADCHLDFAVEKTDVVLLVHQVWKESFAVKATNKKAIAERGWGPLNYVLLDHPELSNTQQQTSSAVTTAYQLLDLSGSQPFDPEALNTSQGMAGTLMDKLVDRKSRELAWDETFLHDVNACTEHAHQKMANASRLMAGVFIAACHHELGIAALEKVRACVELKHQKELELIRKRDEEEEKLRQKVLAIHGKEEA